MGWGGVEFRGGKVCLCVRGGRVEVKRWNRNRLSLVMDWVGWVCVGFCVKLCSVLRSGEKRKGGAGGMGGVVECSKETVEWGMRGRGGPRQ